MSSMKQLKRKFGETKFVAKRARPTSKRSFNRLVSLPGGVSSTSSEMKALDLPVAVYPLNATGAVTPLNLIRTGTSFMNRIGRKIQMKSLRVNGRIDILRTVADEDYVRVLLIYDRQTNGTAPAITDILQTTDQAAANTTTAFSGANLNNRDRFVILRDQHIYLPSLTSTAGVITNVSFVDQVSKQALFDWYVKLPNYVTQYKADSSPAVIGDVATGGLFLVTFGAQTAGQEGYQIALESRLRYLDF